MSGRSRSLTKCGTTHGFVNAHDPKQERQDLLHKFKTAYVYLPLYPSPIPPQSAHRAAKMSVLSPPQSVNQILSRWGNRRTKSLLAVAIITNRGLNLTHRLGPACPSKTATGRSTSGSRFSPSSIGLSGCALTSPTQIFPSFDPLS